MYRNILVPIDLGDTALAKPAMAAALMMASQSGGSIRLVNVLPMTPVVLAEYVPADFDAQQRKATEEALAILARETGLPAERVSTSVRQGGIYQEILEEAVACGADLIVMTSQRSQRHAVRTYFLGSSTGHVVRYAKCSVLVVRN
jgi:nucleotide-binding universal stress UspA family protein